MVLMDGNHGPKRAHGHLWSVITTVSMETLWFLCVNSLLEVAKAPGDLGQSLRKGTIAKPRYHMVPREVLQLSRFTKLNPASPTIINISKHNKVR